MAPYNRYNGWLPADPAVYRAFIDGLFTHAIKRKYAPGAAAATDSELLDEFGDDIDANITAEIGGRHHECVRQFAIAIVKNRVMLDLFENIFKQASQPQLAERKIESFKDLLYLLDVIVSEPPKFQLAEGAIPEPVGVPMYLLFDILSNTSAAYDLFRMKEFNKAMADLLNCWGKYLQGPGSDSSLNPGHGGWFSPAAISMLQANDRGSFNETYVVPNPDLPNRGYTSWDAFFTREVQENARPLELLPGYERDRMVFNACESTVERWRYRVKAHDRFWLKGMPYSLYDIFLNEASAKNEAEKRAARKFAEETANVFVGGTVYQAFLSPQDYHRWRSPIDGVVKSAYRIPGTYYAVLPDEGFYPDEPEDVEPSGALIRCQPWLTVAATRAVFIIEGSKHIGRVAFVAIGMCEVSSCDITVKEGTEVKAGEELGMFHFGGSSHVVIFNPEAKIRLLNEEGIVKIGNHLKVKSALAVSTAK
ncbi:phosphatidylserine decarboxylase [Rhizoctonia solani]|uniref:Phosphatidylserine decarboxylase n=1 Tax=Rhizoctonia solani TaxID=456999 RepID=A0A0K6GD68_9AGAM|nr:phosphatidylserine decarboxylase [Rhizoctonia solani]